FRASSLRSARLFTARPDRAGPLLAVPCSMLAGPLQYRCMGHLRLELCGTISIEHPEGVIREADLPARQGRRLWAYLVLNRRRPIPRDELAEAIWGDAIPDAWDAGLNARASRLRAAVRPLARHGVSTRAEVGRDTLHLRRAAP